MKDIGQWLEQIGLGKYRDLLVDNAIDLDVLPELERDDLKDLGIPIGDVRRLLRAIRALDAAPAPGLDERSPAAPEVAHAPVDGEAERRQLTVMFADLVGSTQLAERLDPEDLREINRAYQDAAKAAIESHEGFVARYMGDGVLAYFGYPRAHEDDAERALRAGLALIDAVQVLAVPVKLSVRVGVATGPVVVGDMIGEGASQESAVVGQTPNLAARLQSVAGPDALVIADHTRRLTAGAFVYADLGEHTLKGFEEPVQAWGVLGESAATSRFEALRGADITAFVGREHDLGMLLERWELAVGGEGQAVLVTGEAGIGKSRATEALRARLADSDHLWIRHQCTPQHTNSALRPFIAQLEHACGFERDDAADEKLRKLETLLAPAGVSPGDQTFHVLADLLSIVAEGRPALDLSPQERKAKTFEALTGQLAHLASVSPVVWVFEDAHWADPTSRELLEHTVDRLQERRVLAVVTTRPEYEPAWAGLGHASALPLGRLSRSQSSALIENVTGARALPEVVQEQIIAKTDGVPLFVEELTKAVLESGMLVRHGDRYQLLGPFRPMALPGTLHDSLMARLDRLGPAKQIAQTAAAIGRDFTRDILSRVVSEDAATMDRALDELVAAGLLFRRGVAPAERFVFKHALVQDAALDSMLRRTRQSVHHRIAEALEAGIPAVRENEPELLAHHYSEAAQADQAIRYWQLAGQRSAARSAYIETVSHVGNALRALATLPQSAARDERELALQAILGPAQMAVHGFASDAVEQTYTRARELCARTGRTEQLFQTIYGLFRLNLIRSKLDAAAALAGDLLAEAERADDRTYRITAHRAIGNSGLWLGEVDRAMPHLMQGAALYQRHTDRGLALTYGDDPRVDCLIYAALGAWWRGHAEQATALRSQSLGLAREIAHPFSLARALALSGLLDCFCRDFSRLDQEAGELIELTAEHRIANWSGVARMVLGIKHTYQGNATVGGDLFERGYTQFRSTGGWTLTRVLLPLVADAYARTGDAGAGLAALRKADQADDSTKFWEADMYRVQGDLAARSGAAPEAIEASLQSALSVSRRQGSRALELRAATSLARFLSRQGQPARARTYLAPVCEWFTEGLDSADLEDAREVLSTLPG